METSFKTGFAQISFAAQKIWVAKNVGGGCSPPSPPGPYAYEATEWKIDCKEPSG